MLLRLFGEGQSPSVKIDWSLYGGAESTHPPARQGTSLASSSRSTSASLSDDSGSDHEVDASLPSLSRYRSRVKSNQSDTSVEEEGQGGDKRALTSTVGKESSKEAGLAWLPPIADPQDGADFLWLLTEEPHRSRRKAILAAHPEIKKLMGHEPWTKWISLSVLLLQVSIAVALGYLQVHPLDWKFLLTAYAIGGTANQNTFLAIHEITHNLAFKSIQANKWWAILVNCAIGVPYAMLFKPYHIEHHKHLGEEGMDTDLPTKFELLCLKNVLGKAFFATFQIFFYALRPGFVKVQKPTVWLFANLAVLLAFDCALVRTAGWYALFYLLESSFFAGSLHPCAAHFIAEHYMFAGVQMETWSYYGPLNLLAYNVGYHNEHHDFPSVPWSRLPALRQAAPEFYDVLPCHTSWPLVTLQFILGTDSGLYARIKRLSKTAGCKALQGAKEAVQAAGGHTDVQGSKASANVAVEHAKSA